MKNVIIYCVLASFVLLYCKPKINNAEEQKRLKDSIERVKWNAEMDKKIIEERDKENKNKVEAVNAISISDYYVTEDGSGFNITWQNLSEKTIKYIHFTVEPKNAVGDPIYKDFLKNISKNDGLLNRNDYYLIRSIRIIGPIKPKEWYGENTIYNSWNNCERKSEIKSISINSILIEYMDGTSLVIGQLNALYCLKLK